MPTLSEKPWLGFWVGHEDKKYDFGIGGGGVGEVHFKKDSRDGIARISFQYLIKVQYFVEEELKGKWVRRQMVDDGFETEQEASDEVESFEFVSTFTGDTKAKFGHVIGRKDIRMTAALGESPSKNPLRVGIEFTIPNLYRYVKFDEMSEREAKKKLKGDEIRVQWLKGKKAKYDLSDEVNLSDESLAGEGAAAFSLESRQIAGSEFLLSLGKPKTGRIVFKQAKSLHEGLKVIWYPEPELAEKEGTELVLAVK
ncbi:MAG: hypothetical protein AAGC74_03245 [Verrucomicrobiota bacterium]